MSTIDWAIFSDFDGTLTDHDTIDLIADRYLGREYWRGMERRFAAGEITVRDWLDDEFGRLSIPPEEVQAYLLEHVRIDTGLKELTAYAREHGYPIAILSSGMDLLIHPLLAAAGCDTAVRCNRLVWEPEPRRYRVEYLDDSDNGHDKAAALREAKAEGRRILFLGDGITDLACADEADVVFAHRALARHCEQRGIEYHPLRGCSDVVGWLKKHNLPAEVLP